MATIRQRKAVNNLVGNGGNITKAMRDAKYSENTLNTPQKLTESKGFKEICDEIGLTEDFIVQCLIDDIQDKPRNRATELQLGAKMRGLLSDKIDITSKGEVIKGFNYLKPNDAQNNSKTSDKPKDE